MRITKASHAHGLCGSLLNSAVTVLLSSSIFAPRVAAVFTDEAYKVDFQHQLLGLPQSPNTFFYRPRVDERASLLYTLSDLDVVAAVNPGTGAIVWRHVLEAPVIAGDVADQKLLRAVEGQGLVVSASRGRVNGWDAANGRERWNNQFDGTVRDLEGMETASTEHGNDVLLLTETAAKTGLLRRLDGQTGDVKWEYADQTGDLPLQVSTNIQNVFVVALHGSAAGYNLKVSILDPVYGLKVDEYTLASKADVFAPEDISFVGANSAGPIIAWTDKALKTLKINVLGTKGIQTFSLGTQGEETSSVTIHAPHLAQAQPHFLVHSQSASAHWADVYHINIATGSISEGYHLPKAPGSGAFATSSDNANVYFTRFTDDAIILVSSASHGILGRWPVHAPAHGLPLHGVSEVVVRSVDHSYAVRSAFLNSNGDWVMLQKSETVWSRPEGISGVIAAEWADIPEAVALAESLEVEAHSNPLEAYIHRVNRHIDDLQYLPAYLQGLPKRFLSSLVPSDDASVKSETLARDNFGLRKLFIGVTRRGRAFALDTGNNGAIVWSEQLFNLAPGEKLNVEGIFVDAKSTTVSILDDTGEIVSVDIRNGGDLKRFRHILETPVIGSAIVTDNEGSQKLLPIAANGSPGSLHKDLAPTSQIVVQNVDGHITGFRYVIHGEEAIPTPVWTFVPPVGQKVINVATRPALDPVASIGRVLGDRSVMYKYLNPNTLLVTVTSENSASFYLLDSVSGDILYVVTHNGVDVKQPIASVMSENWFAYSFWGDFDTSVEAADIPASRGYQLVVSDLYESELANDRGPLGDAANYSAVEPLPFTEKEYVAPHVISQSFFLPEAITNMAVSKTRQGITSKQLLAVVPRAHAIAAIPRNVLDPRRIVGRDPVAAELEEGLLKYHPVIELDPKMDITHERDVLVDAIITSPALLESTSLVAAYGIDIFATRVTPSMAFDILGPGFNKLSLIATVAALAVGVSVLAPMVRRKQINARWQR